MAMVAQAMAMAVAMVAMVAMVMAAAAHSAVEGTGPVASTEEIQQLITATFFTSDVLTYLHKFQL